MNTGADGNRSVRQNEWQGNGLGNVSPLSAANSGAVEAEIGADDPRLAWLIDAWPMLSEDTRDAIVMLSQGEKGLAGDGR
ncbi:MAG: hypothetical protein NT013_00425 [Planctomycetia bacterium]|nr:hypothetical protein [Planctomycetia bacterium]